MENIEKQARRKDKSIRQSSETQSTVSTEQVEYILGEEIQDKGCIRIKERSRLYANQRKSKTKEALKDYA